MNSGETTAEAARIQRGALEFAPQAAVEDASLSARSQSAASDAADELLALRRELEVARHEHSRLRQAVFEAAQVQRRLCAPRELVRGEFEIAGEIFPVRHLSGDFFKVMELGSELGIIVGDIAGKGLSAGIWLTYLMGLIQCCAREHGDPAQVVAEANRQLCNACGEPPMTALFFGRVNPSSGEVVYCNAGLPPPLILSRNAAPVCLDQGGPMLGALAAAKFTGGRVGLGPGDTLVAYSDGVTECRNAQEDEFDIKRLARAASCGGSANGTLFSTLGAVLDFAGGCAPGDDLTLLVLRRRESPCLEIGRSGSRDFSKLQAGRTSEAQHGGPLPKSSVS